jgi:hypothetical protein
MALTAREIAKLRRIIAISERIFSINDKPKQRRPALRSHNGASGLANKRTRRTGKDLVEFRNTIKAELKKGRPVVQIAKRHGVSTSYIYQL